jgi:hypothetical protein
MVTSKNHKTGFSIQIAKNGDLNNFFSPIFID